MKRRTIQRTLLATVALGAVLSSGLERSHAESRAQRVAGDQLAIRLIGVRPDLSDDILDAQGRKIGQDPSWSGSYSLWNADEQRRDFLFEVSEADRAFALVLWHPIRVSQERIGIGSGVGYVQAEGPGRKLLVVQANVRREYRLPDTWLWTRSAPVKRVDVTLRYWYGPRGRALATFAAPFLPGREKRAQNDPAYVLTPRIVQQYESGAGFHLSTTKSFDSSTAMLAYDKTGKRHRIDTGSGSSGSSGAEIDLRVPGLTLPEVTLITLGEKPREKTFKNITVSYPDRPARTYPVYIDKMAEALGLHGKTPEELCQYSIEDPQDAIKVLNIARGYHRDQAFRTLRYKPAGDDLLAADNASGGKLRQSIARMTQATNPNVSIPAVELGLKAGWPGFLDRAIELLNAEDPRVRSCAVDPVYGHAKDLSPDHVRVVAKVLLSADDPALASRLIPCLWVSQSPERLDALVQLAKDDRPWLWWPAVSRYEVRKELARRGEFNRKIKKRILIATGEGLAQDPEGPRAEAYESLPKLLSADVRWSQAVLEHIAILFDRDAATAVLIDFLRDAEGLHRYGRLGAIVRAVQYINLWHGTNLGALGRDPSQFLPSHTAGVDWPGIIEDVIAWYKTGVDPALLPAGYEPKSADLRIVWRNLKDPDRSRAGVWRFSEDEGTRIRAIFLKHLKDYLSCRIVHDGSPDPYYSVYLWYGVLQSHGRFARHELGTSDLPKQIVPDTGRSKQAIDRRGWQDDWEVWLEPLGASESVLGRARLQAALKEVSAAATSRPAAARSGLKWGLPRDGLRAGLELLSDRNVTLRSSRVRLKLRLHLQNISDHSISLAMCSTGHAEPGWFTGFNSRTGLGIKPEMQEPTWSRRTLAPDEVFSFDEQLLEFDLYKRRPGTKSIPDKVMRTILSDQVGRRLLQYELQFPPHRFAELGRYKEFRREGDFSNCLQTGFQEIVLSLPNNSDD